MKQRQRWIWAGFLSVGFCGLFFALRAMPSSECLLLHYEPSDNIVEGEPELCSTAPRPFIDVARAPFPVSIETKTLVRNDDGMVDWVFSVHAPDGDRLLAHELAITHTQRIHLMLIDDTLDSYRHLHPVALGTSGLFQVRFLPEVEKYRFFAEFVPARTRQIAVADGTLNVPSGVAEYSGVDSEIEFRLEGIDQPIRKNRDHRIVLELSANEEGKNLPIEMTMGAFAHLVAFEETLSGYAHMHPLTVDPAITDSARMEFVFHPTRSGVFRVWVQIRSNGQDLFRPFDVRVI